MSRPHLISTTPGTNLGAFTPVDWVIFASLGLTWGSSFLLMAIGIESFHPGLVSFLRVVAASLFFLSIRRVRTTKVAREDWPRLIVLGFSWVAIPFTLFPIAQQWIASGVAGMLNGTTPIFTAILATVLLQRLPSRTQRVGLILGLAGVALITLPSAQDGTSEALGVVLGLVAAASYAVAINVSVPLLQKYGSLAVMGRMMWLGALLLAPFGLYALPRSTFTGASFTATMIVGFVGTGLAFVFAGKLAGSVGATRSAFVAYVMPVVAVILGVIFRDETFAILAMVGVVLVISGAMLASRREL